MESWRLLDLDSDDPAINLSVEESVARSVGCGKSMNTLRLWRNSNCIVLGSFQSLLLEVDLRAQKKYKTRVIRRFTGGGAVYHDLGCLNYSVSIRQDPSYDLGHGFEIFRRCLDTVTQALTSLGVSAKFRPVNSIFVGDRKIVGSAGAIKWGCIFHHGSILVKSDLQVLEELLSPPPNRERHFTRSVKSPVTNLEDELHRSISMDEVRHSLKEAFSKNFRVKIVEDELNLYEREIVDELYKNKYSCDEWNLRL